MSEQIDPHFEICSDISNVISLISRQMAQLEHEKRRLESVLEKHKKRLMKICDHTWEMEPPQYQTPTSWYCPKCKNYK
jgi:hypothetical protein